jgi:carbon-monoxide dehydrogenase small subunit
MSKKEKPGKRPGKDPVELSRREFLKDAGFVIGGATLGSMAFLTACGGAAGTETVTKTVTSTTTSTVGAGQTVTVTTTVAGAGPEGLVHLVVNGVDYWGKVEPNWTLAYVLREKLGLTGTKRGCKAGDCGACTVIMNGRPVLSCLVLAIEADGLTITTIEGLQSGDSLHPLQQAFIDEDALQCGFCTPAMITTAKALLDFKPNPTEAEIKEFMAGTICRCGAYTPILKAIQSQAG